MKGFDVSGFDGTVTVNGQALKCRLDGPEGAPWLVFSNSLMTDLSLWNGQVAAFGNSHRILRYDQRGHGGTPVPPEACTFDQLRDDLAALLTHFDVTAATVVGISMGGVTVLGLGAAHPARVARIMLCDCGPASAPAGSAAWDERIAVAQAGGMDALAGPTIERWFRPQTLQSGLPGVDRVRTMIKTTPLDGFIRAARALQNYDYRPALATLPMPVHLAVGENDAAVPAAMRAMAESCPGATLTIIPDSGHLPNIEQEARFNAALASIFV